MKKVYQPLEADGCWPACIASLFEVDLQEVAHLDCSINPRWAESSTEWLNDRGLTWLKVSNQNGTWPLYALALDGLLAIAVGKTGRGCRHCVIVRLHCTPPDFIRFETIHDPIRDGGGLVSITEVIFFPKLL